MPDKVVVARFDSEAATMQAASALEGPVCLLPRYGGRPVHGARTLRFRHGVTGSS
jgi:hypothetical protein